MAGIDKTYANTWEQYKEIRDWAEDKVVEYPNGIKEHLSNYVYLWNEDDFSGDDFNGERPVWNTPTCLDRWLWLNCPIELVRQRLQEQYGEKYLKDFENPTYVRNGLGKSARMRVLKRPRYKLKQRGCWWVQIVSDDCYLWDYDDESDQWHHRNEYCPTNTNTAYIKANPSVKTILRAIRKWDLPAGMRLRITGRYVQDTWVVEVKK